MERKRGTPRHGRGALAGCLWADFDHGYVASLDCIQTRATSKPKNNIYIRTYVGRSALGATGNRGARISLVLWCKTKSMIHILYSSKCPQWSYYCIHLSLLYHDVEYITSCREPKISFHQGVFSSQWVNSRARAIFWPPDFRWRRASAAVLDGLFDGL